MHILLTNDDGFESIGLLTLADALSDIAKITVVAPTMEKSASGHSLTLTRPLHFVEIRENFYRLDDGTPSDCVFLALNKLFTKDNYPDLVISGINKGANMGEDVTYSGTVAAAMESVLQGIPAIAISQVCDDMCQNIDELGYDLACQSIKELVQKIESDSFPLPPRRLLNVNIPPIPPKQCNGYKITRAGNRVYGNDAQVHHNPRGKEYYWIGLPRLDWLETPGETTDFEAVSQNYISVTPIHLDMTSYDDIGSLKKWI